MLSEHERMIWDEIERNYQAEADEAARGRLGLCTGAGRSGPRGDLTAVVVGGGWGAVLLVLFGVPSAGVAFVFDRSHSCHPHSLPTPGKMGRHEVAGDGPNRPPTPAGMVGSTFPATARPRG